MTKPAWRCFHCEATFTEYIAAEAHFGRRATDPPGCYPLLTAVRQARALEDVIKAWDSLRTGDYPRDIIETWLADKMKPAIERARKTFAVVADAAPEA